MNSWDELESELKTSVHPSFADRLLAGALESDNMLGAYGHVADIVGALQAPAFERELARQAETVDEMSRILRGRRRGAGRTYGRRGAVVIAAAATMSTSVAWASGVPPLVGRTAAQAFERVETAVVSAVGRGADRTATPPTAAAAPAPVEPEPVAEEKLAVLDQSFDVDGATVLADEQEPEVAPEPVAVEPVVEVAFEVPAAASPPVEAPGPPPAPPAPPVELVPVELEPESVNPEALGDEVVLDRTGRPVPGQPGAGRPEDPGKPGDPGRPEDPGKPGDPGRPDGPGKPEDPGQPGDPGKPEDPPGKPEDPGQPGDPGKPEDPPGTPEDPGQPGDPGKPEDRGRPDHAGGPGHE